MKTSTPRYYLLLVLTSATLGRAADNITLETEGENAEMAHCLLEIIDNLMEDALKMSMFGRTNSTLLRKVLRLTQVPVLINAEEPQRTEGLETRVPNDLVLVTEDAEVGDLLTKLLWHAETRFILAYEDGWDGDVFREFWREKVINVYALVSQEDGDIVLYSFQPYEKDNCEAANPIALDRWSRGGFLGSGLSEVQKGRRITNLNNCPVNVTVVDVKPHVFFRDECSCNGTRHIGGIEGDLMKEIARKFNMNATYVIALDGIGWGWIHPMPHGVVGEVFTGRSDFGIGLLAPTIERFENLQLTVPYDGFECITYGVPKGAGAKQPTWIKILVFEFPGHMWLLIVFVFAVTAVCFFFVNRILNLALFPVKLDLFIYLLDGCLGTPIKIKNSATLRIAVLSWIVFSFIITVAYRSSMGSRLTVPTPDPDINTFRELLQSDLKLTGYNNMLRLMQYNDSDQDIKQMVDRFVVTNFGIGDALDAIARHEKIAHVRHSTTFLYYSLISVKAKGHIHLLKDCIYRYYPLFVMKKNSPFERRTNEIISRLKEGGVVGLWMSRYIYHPPARKSNTFEKLSLNHTFGMFFIVLLGYGLALVTFACELAYFRFRKSHGKLARRVKGDANKPKASDEMFTTRPRDFIKLYSWR